MPLDADITRRGIARLLCAKCSQLSVAADERNAFGHEVLGRILLLQGEHVASIAAHETSLELNPNYANAHYGLAFALCFIGQPDRAMGELDEARVGNTPRSPGSRAAFCGRARVQRWRD